MSLGETSTSSPRMLQIREALENHTASGPITVFEISELTGIYLPTLYGYLRKLEHAGLAHIAAWRLEYCKIRIQEIPEWMPGPGSRAPKSSRSRRELDERKCPLIVTKVAEVSPIPFDYLLVALGGIKQGEPQHEQ